MAESRRFCIACGSELTEEARLCNSCGSYQSFWRNELRYWATVAGVFSIVAASIGFSISAWPDIRKSLFWRDSIEILQFSRTDSHSAISVFNTGDGTIWIENLTYEAGGSFTYHLSVAATVQPNEILNKILFENEPEDVTTELCAIDESDTAQIINAAPLKEDRYVEFLTNPDIDPEDIELFAIPGKVNVRYRSLRTSDWYTVESGLFALVFEDYPCQLQ